MMKDRRVSQGRWLWPLAGAVICLGLGTASGLVSVGGDATWYQELVRPPGTPPSWVFGPVWSVLYVLMGISLGRLVHRRAWQAVTVFATQFLLNFGWTPVFFGMHQIAAAMALIGAVWLGVAATASLAWNSDKVSAWLLAP